MTGKKELTEKQKWDKLPWQIKMADSEWQKFWRYVEIMDGEVGCFGYAKIDERSKEVVVDTIFLFPQESDASQVDFIEDGLTYAIERAVEDDRLDDLRFCIHSHGMHGAFWSGTDEDMIQKMGITSSWFASAIFNKKRESVGRIDTFTDTPFGRCQWTVDKKMDVVSDTTIEKDETAMKELAEFVKKPRPVQGKGWVSGGNAANTVYSKNEVKAGKEGNHSDQCKCTLCQDWRQENKSQGLTGTEDTFEKMVEEFDGEDSERWFSWVELTDDVLRYEQALNLMGTWQLAKVVAQSGDHYFYGDQGRTFLAFEKNDKGEMVMKPAISRVALNSWELAVDPEAEAIDALPVTQTHKELMQ